MRYLIFGDVHGNLLALETMLKEENNNYDVLISHGDVVNYGPWSNECVDLLESMNCICLKGNHEEYFLKGEYEGKNVIAKAFFSYCYPFFNKQKNVLRYTNEYLLNQFSIQHTIGDAYIYPDTDLSQFLIDRNYLIGHSHYQFAKKQNGFDVINTGSVGQNREFINVISYVIMDEEENVRMKSMIYDVEKVIKEMAKRNYPDICLNYYRQKERA